MANNLFLCRCHDILAVKEKKNDHTYSLTFWNLDSNLSSAIEELGYVTHGAGRIRASTEASFSLILIPNSFAYGSF